MENLKRIFSSVLGVPAESITSETSPENTPSWDSLNAIVLVVEIEKAFRIKFAYDEAVGVKNFGEVVALIKSKMPEFHD